MPAPELASNPKEEFVPRSYEALKREIAERYDQLPKRLRQIADFAMAQPDFVALETVVVIAQEINVQPSSLIRFAKLFDFDGFSDMQQVFRTRLIDRVSNYSDRIRAAESENAAIPETGVLQQLAAADAASLAQLARDIPQAELERVADALSGARVIGVVAQRRSFPVATYLAYALSHLGLRAVLIDNIGGMNSEQARMLSEGDALIAISFAPYAPETLSVVGQAKTQGARTIVITDKGLTRLVSLADIRLEVVDARVKGIRSLTTTICLATAIVLALGHRLEQRAPKRTVKRPSRR